MNYPPDSEDLTENDRTLLASIEGVSDPYKRRELLTRLRPEEFARLVELGYAATDSIIWPGPAGELPDGEEPISISHRDAGLVVEQARNERIVSHDALERLGEDPPGIAVVLAGIDDPAAAVASLGLPKLTTDTGDGKKKRPLTLDERPDVFVEDGWIYVVGKTGEEVAAALVATRG